MTNQKEQTLKSGSGSQVTHTPQIYIYNCKNGIGLESTEQQMQMATGSFLEKECCSEKPHTGISAKVMSRNQLIDAEQGL